MNKIFWVGKKPTELQSGEVIYDRKLTAALKRAGVDLSTIYLSQVSRLKELLNLVCFIPYYRAKYYCKRNIELASSNREESSIKVISWEAFDIFAYTDKQPCIIILHNITSSSLRNLFPRNPLFLVLSFISEYWEKHIYLRPNVKLIVILSKDDERYLRFLGIKKKIIWVPPGAPPFAGIEKNAFFSKDVVLSGTYGWYPKRRALKRFAKQFMQLEHPFNLKTDDALPVGFFDGIEIPKAEFSNTHLVESNLRLGLITDDFSSGHKLKTLFFIANNCIVLTFSDVIFDFSDIRDASFFIRRISLVADIRPIIDEFSEYPRDELIERFTSFKSACSEIFSWDIGASKIISEIGSLEFQAH